MSALDRYPEWPPGTPRTDPAARVCRYRPAIGVRAMQVTNGHYRGATVSGVFELYKPELNDPVEVTESGKKQVQVICAWYGGRPNKNSGARIDLGGTSCHFRVLDAFSGEVADSIGRVTNPLPHPYRATTTPPTLPTPSASDIADAPAGRVQTTTYRILRDTELARRVKVMHEYRCQVCSHTIELASGSRYAEAHHIQPLGEPHNGPDVIGNILCVCPNHHAELDYLVSSLTLSALRLVPGHTVNQKYVDYHNRLFKHPETPNQALQRPESLSLGR